MRQSWQFYNIEIENLRKIFIKKLLSVSIGLSITGLVSLMPTELMCYCWDLQILREPYCFDSS